MKPTRTKLMLAAAMLLVIVTSAAFSALTARVVLTVNTSYTATGGLGTTSDSLNLDYGVTLTNGTGANQANVIYHASRSLADDANEVLCLDDDSLTDPLGSTIEMNILKALVVYNTSSEASLTIGGGTKPVDLCAEPNDVIVIPAGGKFMYAAPSATGLALTDHNDLNFTHNGEGTAALTYKVIIVGVDS
jgi:hypothetical protein